MLVYAFIMEQRINNIYIFRRCAHTDNRILLHKTIRVIIYNVFGLPISPTFFNKQNKTNSSLFILQKLTSQTYLTLSNVTLYYLYETKLCPTFSIYIQTKDNNTCEEEPKLYSQVIPVTAKYGNQVGTFFNHVEVGQEIYE